MVIRNDRYFNGYGFGNDVSYLFQPGGSANSGFLNPKNFTNVFNTLDTNQYLTPPNIRIDGSGHVPPNTNPNAPALGASGSFLDGKIAGIEKKYLALGAAGLAAFLLTRKER